MLAGVVLIIVIVVAPVMFLMWRFRRNEDAVAGGSMGHQFLGRKKSNGWGPTSNPPPK